MSDDDVLHPQQPARTPWTPVTEEQAQERAAEEAEMLRKDAARLADAQSDDVPLMERGDTTTDTTQP
jgi:hypothetical protein